MKTPKHPQQPICTDSDGTARFRANKIVRYLLDAGGIDMQALAIIPFDDEDRAQFMQLIGYSVCGYEEMPYTKDYPVEESQ